MSPYAKLMQNIVVKHIKSNVNAKLAVRDIKHHFKEDKWPLGYQVYKEIVGIKDDDQMHLFLDMMGYSVYYDVVRGQAMFKPKRRVNASKGKKTKRKSRNT